MTSPAVDLSLADAIATFAVTFAAVKSVRHPYVATDFGASRWRLADADRRRAADYRGEEWVCLAHDVVGTVEQAAADARDPARWGVSVLLPEGDDDGPLRETMRARGHRLMTTESMMVRPLTGRGSALPRAVGSPAQVVRLTTADQAEELRTATRRRTFRPEWIEGDRPMLRQFLARIGGELVGWVGSMRSGDIGSVTNLYVAAAHRRRGVGTALMTHLLADDKRNGIRTSTLLASHSGAMLYPRVGYHRIATLYLYSGKRHTQEGKQQR
jgi:ribosomal protein S18 acetylase RimI-like enzyme